MMRPDTFTTVDEEIPGVSIAIHEVRPFDDVAVVLEYAGDPPHDGIDPFGVLVLDLLGCHGLFLRVFGDPGVVGTLHLPICGPAALTAVKRIEGDRPPCKSPAIRRKVQTAHGGKEKCDLSKGEKRWRREIWS